jgi:hypothetical protein
VKRNGQPLKGAGFRESAVQLATFLFVVTLFANLNVIVDRVLHPVIPYFDQEHLIVGGAVGVVSAVLAGLLMLRARCLEQALSKIGMLESILPICAGCKKIRIPDADPAAAESWQSVETCFTEHATVRFSHGVCLDCRKQLYSKYI